MTGAAGNASALDERLIAAVDGGSLLETEDLLRKGANPNAKNWAGNPVLFMALTGGYTMVAKVLVGAGADANESGASGLRPLHAAARMGLAGLAKDLVAAGADVNARAPSSGATPLIMAALSERSLAVMEVLLEAGADPNTGSFDGTTPLMILARGSYGPGGEAEGLAEAELLLEWGADAFAVSKDGTTAVDQALIMGNVDLAGGLRARMEEVGLEGSVMDGAALPAKGRGL